MMTVGEWLKKNFGKRPKEKPLAQFTATQDPDNKINMSIHGTYPKQLSGIFLDISFVHSMNKDIDDNAMIVNGDDEPVSNMTLMWDYSAIVHVASYILSSFDDVLDLSVCMSTYMWQEDETTGKKYPVVTIITKVKPDVPLNDDLFDSIRSSLRDGMIYGVDTFNNRWYGINITVGNVKGM